MAQRLTTTLTLLALTLGCAKAGSGDRAATGVERLERDELRAFLDQAKWRDPPGWRVIGGIKLTEAYAGDLASDAELPLPEELVRGLGEAERLILVLRLTTEDETPGAFRRLTLATVGKLASDGVLALANDRVRTFLPEASHVGRQKALGQEGPFVLVEHSGGIAFLAGRTGFVSAGRKIEEMTTMGPALVSASSSPFVARSARADGLYLLPVPKGVPTVVAAYLPPESALLRTPAVASAYVPRPGAPEALSEAIELREAALDPQKNEAAQATFAWLRSKPQDLAGAPLIEVQLPWSQAPEIFVEPPEQEPDEAPVEPPPPGDGLGPQPDPLPPEGSLVARIEPGREGEAPQIDLGCTGVTAENVATLTTNGAAMRNEGVLGWVGTGDVRVTRERFAEIFGEIAALKEESDYFDDYEGYCLLTTGTGRYAKSLANEAEASQLRPGPAGSGKLSEIWQRVAIPSLDSGYRSLQIRLAMFTEDAEGGPLSDGFFVKFDEDPGFLAMRSLEQLSDEMKSLPENLAGPLWDLELSTEALAGCEEDAPCYRSYVPPRVLCHELETEQFEKTLTLRIAAFDGADPFGDSALAIDSIVFSKEGCSRTFTGEPKLP